MRTGRIAVRIVIRPVERDNVRVLQACERQVLLAAAGSHLEDDGAIGQGGLRGQEHAALHSASNSASSADHRAFRQPRENRLVRQRLHQVMAVEQDLQLRAHWGKRCTPPRRPPPRRTPAADKLPRK